MVDCRPAVIKSSGVASELHDLRVGPAAWMLTQRIGAGDTELRDADPEPTRLFATIHPSSIDLRSLR
jgi:hypothetical protein